jgi:hypothetical protein
MEGEPRRLGHHLDPGDHGISVTQRVHVTVEFFRCDFVGPIAISDSVAKAAFKRPECTFGDPQHSRSGEVAVSEHPRHQRGGEAVGTGIRLIAVENVRGDEFVRVNRGAHIPPPIG